MTRPVAAALGLCLLPIPALAASLSLRITHAGDAGAGSLREAIAVANQLGPVDIDLQSVPGPIRLRSPLPVVTGSLRLIGPPSGFATLDGDNRWPLLTFAAGSTGEVSRVILTHGLATGYRNGAAISNAGNLLLRSCTLVANRNEFGWGGALYNEGALQALDCRLQDNVAIGEPGSLASYIPGPGPDPFQGWKGSMPGGGGAGFGGAIFHQLGTLLLDHCELVGNEATGGAGGDFNSFLPARTGTGRGGGPEGGVASLDAAPSAHGGFGGGGGGAGLGRPGDGGFGGGAGGVGAGALSAAAGFGGGSTDPRAGGPAGGGAGMGGALFARSGTVSIHESRFVSNRVSGGQGGGGADVAVGAGAGMGGALFVHGAEVAIEGGNFVGNRSTGGTGGIAGGLLFSFPGASGEGQGGAIFNYEGMLRLKRCRATANASQGGPGSPTSSHPGDAAAGRGGALALAGGRTFLDGCTLDANQAQGGIAAGTSRGFARPGSAFGGALWIDGGTNGLTNVTMSANLAVPGPKPTPTSTLTADSWGGALAMDARLPKAPPAVALRFCTVTLNEATRAEGGSQGGGLLRLGGSLSLGGVVCATNRATTNPDLQGDLQSVHRNLIQSPGSAKGLAAHDLTGLNPRLGPLDGSGGSLPVHALLDASPALDAYDAQDFPAFDAVGFPRPQGPAADLGAFERPLANPPSPTLQAIRLDPDGNLSVTIRGAAGFSYALQFSPDLATWSNLGVYSVGATLRLGTPQRAGFYRLAPR